jgi:hypothetical protein
MGRYSSVQSYADNNSAVRSIPYKEATGSAEPKKSAVKTEKVHNPYGSTAGAGSGEFHIYRHARAREMARWKSIDEEENELNQEKEFDQELLNAKTEEELKTSKRRRKRQREKDAKLRKKTLKAAGIDTTSVAKAESSANEEDEFAYIPLARQSKEEQEEEEKATFAVESEAKDEGLMEQKKAPPLEEMPNDGSFLEMMKKRLAEESRNKEASMQPPPAKKPALETRIIDEDDEEGPMLPLGFR